MTNQYKVTMVSSGFKHQERKCFDGTISELSAMLLEYTDGKKSRTLNALQKKLDTYSKNNNGNFTGVIFYCEEKRK